MQALSIWPSKIDFRVVPKLDMGVSRVGSYCILSTRRKRWDFGDYGCRCRRSGLISVSSCLRGRKIGTCLGSSQLVMKYGVFDGCSRFQVYFFSEPKEGRVQRVLALALTLERQTIGNVNCDNVAVVIALALALEGQTIGRVQKAVGEDSVSLDGVSGKNGNCDNVDENGSENEELDRSVKEKGGENKKVGEEKKKERIDVRLLGGSLRLARTAEDVEEVLKDKGELPLQVYSTIIRAFGKEKRLEAAMALVQWLKEKKKHTNCSIGPNIFIYNTLLGAMKESEQFEEVEKVVIEMSTEGVIPNVVTYNILMGIYIRQRKELDALNLFEEMQKKGLSPSPGSCSRALLAYQRMEDGFGALKFYVALREQFRNWYVGKDLEDWESEFSKLEDTTVKICYLVMRGWLVKSGNFSNVLNLLTEMDRVGIFIRQGKEVDALNPFEELQNKGLSPSPGSYSTVLLDYRRAEDGFGALKFYVALREKYRNGYRGKDREDWEIEFSRLEYFTVQICYQVMRGWLVKSRNFSNVLKLFTEMDRVGLPIDRSEYEHLMWACTSEEHYFVAKELYRRIRKRHSEISLSVCNHLIWFMGQAKKWWVALEIYEDLLDKGPEPNSMSSELVVSHFNILLTEVRKKGLWKYGVRLLNKMEEKGLKPGSAQWDAVLVACSKASETYAAFQIFKRMVEQGEKPTVVSYGALLGALEKGKLYDEAQQVWGNMIKVGVQPNVYAYTIMASIYTAQGKINTVDSIIHEMSISGIEITVVTYNAIISACARSNMSGTAYEWFQKMEAQSISPNKVTYEMLIEALTNDGKPKLAYDLYLRARNEGLNLSSKAYDSVIHSSEIYGATIDVDILGPRPPPVRKKIVRIRKNLSEFCNLLDVPRRSSKNNFTLDK